ncbi:hypothetical protein [Halorussus amylolyticus]|uniref:hypothetical protein n=1 Tax=Halorussus amylolyticus TaxID=1126242 RepID=UPI001044B88C|nr:hypothetical protein [Halorussus amylolyticus]
MSDPRKQVKTIRQQKILESFQNSNEPVLTTGEVSERIESVTQETVLDDLKGMRGNRLSGRKTNQGWIWWVPTEDSESHKEKVATEDQLRRAVADLVVSRTDIRILTASLAVLAGLSIGGAVIYLMLELDIWLLPVSEEYAILVNYASMVTAGLAIASSGLAVLGREWMHKG